VSAASGSGFVVRGSHTYSRTDSYGLAVFLLDHQGAPSLTGLPPASWDAAARAGIRTTAWAYGSVVVAEAPLQGADRPRLLAVAGVPLLDAVWAVVGDPNALAPVPSDLHATVAFGDGQAGPGQLLPLGGGQFQVVASHTYAHPGHYRARTVVWDVASS